MQVLGMEISCLKCFKIWPLLTSNDIEALWETNNYTTEDMHINYEVHMTFHIQQFQ